MRVRLSLLFWYGLGFALLAVSNGLLLLDKTILQGADLSGYRLLLASAGVGLLLLGLAREAR
jgi:hypothetical protein